MFILILKDKMRVLGYIITFLGLFWVVGLIVFWCIFVAGELYCINNNLVALINQNWIYYDNDKDVYEVKEFTDFSYNMWK